MVEHIGCLVRGLFRVLDPVGARLRVGKQALAARPGGELNIRKGFRECQKNAVLPGVFKVGGQVVAHDGLDETMYGERVCVGIALDQRVGAQGYDGGVQSEWISGDGCEERAEVVSACGEEFFGDGIGSQEGAET